MWSSSPNRAPTTPEKESDLQHAAAKETSEVLAAIAAIHGNHESLRSTVKALRKEINDKTEVHKIAQELADLRESTAAQLLGLRESAAETVKKQTKFESAMVKDIQELRSELQASRDLFAEVPKLSKQLESAMAARLDDSKASRVAEVDARSPTSAASVRKSANLEGCLRLRILRAHSLANRASGFIHDVSDPYVKATLGGAEHKTPTIKSNLNPVWNYGNEFVFDIRVEDAYLELEVFHANQVFKDLSLGKLTVDFRSIHFRSLDQQAWQSMREPLDGVQSGELEYEVCFVRGPVSFQEVRSLQEKVDAVSKELSERFASQHDQLSKMVISSLDDIRSERAAQVIKAQASEKLINECKDGASAMTQQLQKIEEELELERSTRSIRFAEVYARIAQEIGKSTKSIQEFLEARVPLVEAAVKEYRKFENLEKMIVAERQEREERTKTVEERVGTQISKESMERAKAIELALAVCDERFDKESGERTKAVEAAKAELGSKIGQESNRTFDLVKTFFEQSETDVQRANSTCEKLRTMITAQENSWTGGISEVKEALTRHLEQERRLRTKGDADLLESLNQERQQRAKDIATIRKGK